MAGPSILDRGRLVSLDPDWTGRIKVIEIMQGLPRIFGVQSAVETDRRRWALRQSERMYEREHPS